jgi:hypothetical protein
VVSKTLRFVADLNDFKDIKIECAYDYLVPGTCAALVEVDGARRPKVTQIRWEEFFHDPRSRRKDFSDARYMGIAKWMYAETVASMYPGKAKDIDTAIDTGTPGVVDDTFQDRPQDSLSQWIDRKNRRLMVVEIYHRDTQGWNRCVFHAGGVLDEGESPWQDEKKKPCCGIEAQSCYVDRENNRMGIGRDMRSPQDEFNKRRSKLLHLLSNRQLQVTDPANFMPVDADEARAEAAKPDGILPPGWSPVALNDITAGQFQLLAMAEGEMDREGPNPAILGRQGESQSGRAQLVRQQAGLTEQAVLFGGVESWELRIYRAMWNRCKQFWTAPDFIRVTEEEGAPQFIGINQPQVQNVPAIVAHPETGQPMVGTQQVILGYDNQLAELDVDITLDTVPDTANMQQEQFQTLVDLAQVYGPQEVPFDDILEASALQGKRQLIEKRKQRAEQAGQQGQQQQQLAAQGEMQKVRLTSAQADLAEAQAAEAGWNAQGGEQGPQQPEQMHPLTAQTEQQKAREMATRADLNAARARTESLKPAMDVMKMHMDHQQQTPAAGG